MLAAIAVGFWCFFAHAAVGWLQLEDNVASLAITYIMYIVPVIPMLMLMAIVIACWRGAGDMVIGMIIMSLVNVVNIAVSWALVLGLGPLPELGWSGVAIGTACGYLCGGLFTLLLLVRGRSHLKLQLAMLMPDWQRIKRLLRIGLPGGADMMTVIGCQLWFLSLINTMGTVSAAAHGIALSIESLAFIPGSAFQTSATTLTGQCLGAGQARRASGSVWMSLFVGGGFMTLMGMIFFGFADQLPWLFVKPDNTEVAHAISPLLRIIAVGMPSIAAMMIIGGGLRGAGDTRTTLVISLIGFLGVRIPGTYLLSFEHVEIIWLHMTIDGFGLGVAGAWYAVVLDTSLRAILLAGRFGQGGWSRLSV